MAALQLTQEWDGSDPLASSIVLYQFYITLLSANLETPLSHIQYLHLSMNVSQPLKNKKKKLKRPGDYKYSLRTRGVELA
ncbi:unnamed protein product [Sphenostylis stenocarpa]|uniref:Uncharacterized protein n=1 Tax=Sphenostylis stenocarpa TaxID=92480 RepID=A0AA86VCC4_9FABA|nr:unnamed protein product [Sphenostylis stenocarpa]